jgi:predicted nucleic acid-binding protein
MRYLDTSIVVSVLTRETTTDAATRWLEAQPLNSLASSPWLLVELNASLSRKVRMQRLSLEDHEYATSAFSATILPSLTMLSVDTATYRRAAMICAQHHAGVRAGDALHLAAATTNDMPVATLDKRFAAGATALGYSVELIA